MQCARRCKQAAILLVFTALPIVGTAAQPVRDVAFFLRRLYTLDHLPQLEESHTAMASTWDRSGGNADGTDYKGKEGATNVLFDAEGPGCIHRIFTGSAEPGYPEMPGYLRVDGTRLQVFLDHHREPVFDYLVTDFFDPARGPVPSPLAGAKTNGWTYPGCLFPIPYARHCRVQIVNPEQKNWGSYWQITYTTFSPNTHVRSLQWPPSAEARSELTFACKRWMEAQNSPPTSPARWSFEKSISLPPGRSLQVKQRGAGVIREIRCAVQPATPGILRGLRLTMQWDGSGIPSVDVPAGYFFGHADSGHAEAARFSSLLLGVTDKEAYARFPMPFAKGAVMTLRNDCGVPVEQVRLAGLVEKLRSIPSDWARFHATYSEAPAAAPNGPRFGHKQVPAHLVLERQTCGKYVGTLLRAVWPHEGWWGEGDWLIWSDETSWPPSYHGTGSEEYFNSGWCKFDRKAVSGYVTIHPGVPTEYSFHLNDAFQFRRNIKVAVETMGWDKADQQIREEHPLWGSTAFWYALPAQSGK